MPADLPFDPLLVVAAAGVSVLAFGVWHQGRRRLYALGGSWRASAVLAISLVAMLIAISGVAVPFDIGLLILLPALVAIYRPDLVVRLTGGPRPEWLLLRDIRRLQRDRGSLTPLEVRARLDELEAYRTPETAEVIDLHRELALPGDGDADAGAKRVRLADRLRTMRESLGARPTWERELGPVTPTADIAG